MEKDTIVFNLFGGPSVGKSTTAAGVFSLLKLHDVDCEQVTEFAKDLVWEERHKTFKDQHYIFGKQYHRMWRLKGNVDVMITDSPLLLSMIYRPEKYGDSFVNNVIETINWFDNRNIILRRTKKYNQNGRNETEYEAKEVDKAVRIALTLNNMKWREVDGNYLGINLVCNMILKELQLTPKFEICEIKEE